MKSKCRIHFFGSLTCGEWKRCTDPWGLRLPRYSHLVIIKINIQIKTISKKLVNGRTNFAEGRQESEKHLCRTGCFTESTPNLWTCASDLFFFPPSGGRRVSIWTQIIKHHKCKRSFFKWVQITHTSVLKSKEEYG